MIHVFCDICDEEIWTDKDVHSIKGLDKHLNEVCKGCVKKISNYAENLKNAMRREKK